MKHKHHIIPRHAGGTDDPENILELTVEEHAEAHRLLHEKYGKHEDWVAWKCLSGQIGKEEIQIEKSRMAGINRWKYCRDEMIEISRRGGITNSKSGHCAKIAGIGGAATKGSVFWYNEKEDVETRSKVCPGENWVRGRKPNQKINSHLLKHANNCKDSAWYHNPVTGQTKMIKNKEVPEGWIAGRGKINKPKRK